MYYLVLVFLWAMFFILLFYVGNFLLSNKWGLKNKNSSFESGFSSLGLMQNSFSIHFFVMMLMFVIFDLEVVLFLGMLISDLSSLLSMLMLMLFIVSGFYMEWWYGKLLWII
uniref:NADH-ubiquinone oxidoreductase chain 3 n=1 Tax=Ruizia karukerae TaxID=2201929 RepID=A0A343YNA0_9BILA|nr:NADH dehydrogenase subunit 3 [Ruizia karukerae]